MKWIIIIALLVAAGVSGYVYINQIAPEAHISTSTTTPHETTPEPMRSINVYHAFKDGEHRFSGQVKLPHSCYSLDAEAVHGQRNENAIIIALVAKDKLLDQSLCAQVPTNYPFQIIAEGSEDATIRATINGEDLTVKLTETSWQSGSGTYINTK